MNQVVRYVVAFIIWVMLGIGLLFSTPAKAEGSFWDHAGTTFAIQTVTYGITSRMLGIGTHAECTFDYYYHECEYRHGQEQRFARTEAIIFSGFLTFMGTFAYTYMKQMNGSPMQWREIGYNAVGQVLSIGTIYTFKF